MQLPTIRAEEKPSIDYPRQNTSDEETGIQRFNLARLVEPIDRVQLGLSRGSGSLIQRAEVGLDGVESIEAHAPGYALVAINGVRLVVAYTWARLA